MILYILICKSVVEWGNTELKIPRTIAPSTLVMNAADGVSFLSFQAGPESTVHLLLHFSISSLNCSKIPGTGVITLNLQ